MVTVNDEEKKTIEERRRGTRENEKEGEEKQEWKPRGMESQGMKRQTARNEV